jgi:ER-bound oxygenase mpaB/B'/Rubber oxygenase, catalytic domain
VTAARRAPRRSLDGLDPEADHLEIHRRVTAEEFPWDYGRALEVAILRTCCVPSIAQVLAGSGEFHRRGQKRYDDTRILLGEVVHHGYDSERGRQAIRQVNQAHRHYDIADEDMLYVLSTFVFEPVRWIDRWAWRPMTTPERLAGFHFYRAVGRRLGMTAIPTDYAEFEAFNRDSERRRFATGADALQLGADLLGLYAAMYPAALRPAVARIWPARLDASMRAALGVPEPSRWARWLNAAILGCHATVDRAAPQWSAAVFARPMARSYPGYPFGYRIRDIGPDGVTCRSGGHQTPGGTDWDGR